MATIWTDYIEYGELKNYCYIGNKKPSKYYVGGKEVKRIYLGNKWIYGDDLHSYTIYYPINNGTTNTAQNEITLDQKHVAFLRPEEIVNVTSPITVKDNRTNTYVTNDCTITCYTYTQPPDYVTHNDTPKEYYMNINDNGKIDIGRMNWNMAVPINAKVELNSHVWSKLFTIKKSLAEYKIYLHTCITMSKANYDSLNLVKMNISEFSYRVKFYETFPSKQPNNYQTVNYSKSSFDLTSLGLPPTNDFRYWVDSSITTVYTVDRPNYDFLCVYPDTTTKITFYNSSTYSNYTEYYVSNANIWAFVTDEPISYPPGVVNNNLTCNYSQCKFVYPSSTIKSNNAITDNWFNSVGTGVHLYIVYYLG